MRKYPGTSGRETAGFDRLGETRENRAPLPHERRPVLLRSPRLAFHDRERAAYSRPGARQTRSGPWKTDEPATLEAAGAELGEPSGSRNQQAHIPAGARQPADVWRRS